MASQDVIELGSSDEEPASVPKKRKVSKPVSNAMVHIPKELCGLSITRAVKKPITPQNHKIVSQKINMPKIISVGGFIPNLQKNNKVQVKPTTTILQQPIPIQNKALVCKTKGINPMGLIRKLNSSQIVINKVNPKKSKMAIPKLLPNITITKMNRNLKRVNIIKTPNINVKKPRLNNVPTVELDEEESSASAGPQWYLRPEEQADVNVIKESNDEESTSTKFIEITIEDSPVKPTSSKNINNDLDESAIIIDDSPLKCTDKYQGGSKTKNTKKKLHYPQNIDNKTIEIEIEPMDICVPTTKEDSNKDNESIMEDEPVNPLKQKEEQDDVNIVPNKPTLPENNIEKVENDTVIGEFHPVYQTFIDLCFQLENTDDMTKIVDKKIKAYYKQVSKEYTESEQFIDMVSSKIDAMKNGPDKLYLYIKDIVDELNVQRKMPKAQVTIKDIAKTESDVFLYGENSEYDLKRQIQIRKLEKTLRKLHRAIQKLEEQEVDFDDDEDSVYLLTERYKERMVRVHAKFCQLTNTKMPSEPYIHIDPRPGQHLGPIKKLEKLINRKVPLGTPLPFPDFHDVLKCVREANNEEKLGWNEADIIEQARDLFTRCGKKLQRRRQENEWRSAFSRVSYDIDPAENNDELKKKLESNRHLASKRELEVFNKYADRQIQMKLEAEEIGEKEANESPVESEDDEGDDISLENKENRKKRLKRLIVENSKKSALAEKPTCSKDQDLHLDQLKSSKNTGELTKQVNINIGDLAKQNNVEDIIENNIKEDNKAHLESTDKQITEKSNTDSIQSLSDDSSELVSDIDELHLLQKIHSKDEVNTLESSDSDVSAASSLSSIKEAENAEDIISIENSSYSESDVPILSDDNDKESSDIHEIVHNSDEDVENLLNNDMEVTVVALSDNETISSNDASCNENLTNTLPENDKKNSDGIETNVKNKLKAHADSYEVENRNMGNEQDANKKCPDENLLEKSDKNLQDKILEETLLALSDDDEHDNVEISKQDSPNNCITDKESSDIHEIVNNSDEDVEKLLNNDMEVKLLALSDNETISSNDASCNQTLTKTLPKNEKKYSNSIKTNVKNNVKAHADSYEVENRNMGNEQDVNKKCPDENLQEQSDKNLQEKILEETLLALSDDDHDNAEISKQDSPNNATNSKSDLHTKVKDVPVFCDEIETTKSELTIISENILLAMSDDEVSAHVPVKDSNKICKNETISSKPVQINISEASVDEDLSLASKDKDVCAVSLSKNLNSTEEKRSTTSVQDRNEIKLSEVNSKEVGSPQEHKISDGNKEEPNITSKAGNTQVHIDSALTDTTNVLPTKCTSIVNDKTSDNFEVISAPTENINC